MTSLSTISLGLLVGPVLPPPAPGYLMRALRGVEVTQADEAPSGFQLTFLAEIVASGEWYDIVNDLRLLPFNRVLISAIVDDVPTTLIDGFITHQQFVPGNGPEDATFVVTGEDLSVRMDLHSYSREFPAMPDALIAEAVLGSWLDFGIVPLVLPTPNVSVPIEYVPQQAQTDRALLKAKAAANGYVFHITPGPIPLTNVAYWGPPNRIDLPRAVIDVGVGAASTADTFSATYDALAPETFYAKSVETLVEPFEAIPVATFTSTRFPPLATRPAIEELTLLGGVRETLLNRDDLDPLNAQWFAQARTDVSSDAVVQVTCDVEPARLGSVVHAPGLVGVRGAGEAYDGLYYLKAATHAISLLAAERWNYTQQLTMTREGVGTTTPILKAI